jgi:hypothetical protein
MPPDALVFKVSPRCPSCNTVKLHMICCMPRLLKRGPACPSSLCTSTYTPHAEGVPGRVLPEGSGVAIACKGCLAYTVRLPFLAVVFKRGYPQV